MHLGMFLSRMNSTLTDTLGRRGYGELTVDDIAALRELVLGEVEATRCVVVAQESARKRMTPARDSGD